jgi:leucyl-tRNA synthetase
MQRNWIGKSTGAEITFDIDGSDKSVTVFTTRPDTVHGVSYMVLAPEHDLVKELVAGTEYEEAVEKFITKMYTMTEIERTSSDLEKEGMSIGKHVINPLNGQKVGVMDSELCIS